MPDPDTEQSGGDYFLLLSVFPDECQTVLPVPSHVTVLLILQEMYILRVKSKQKNKCIFSVNEKKSCKISVMFLVLFIHRGTQEQHCFPFVCTGVNTCT